MDYSHCKLPPQSPQAFAGQVFACQPLGPLGSMCVKTGGGRWRLWSGQRQLSFCRVFWLRHLYPWRSQTFENTFGKRMKTTHSIENQLGAKTGAHLLSPVETFGTFLPKALRANTWKTTRIRRKSNVFFFFFLIGLVSRNRNTISKRTSKDLRTTNASIYLYIYIYIYLSVYLSICLSIYLSI